MNEVSRSPFRTVALPEAVGHTSAVADEERICVSALPLPEVMAPQPLGEVPRGKSGCQWKVITGVSFPTLPVVPGQCLQLAAGSTCIPWTCHPDGFTPRERGKSCKTPRFTDVALIMGILRSPVYHSSLIVSS